MNLKPFGLHFGLLIGLRFGLHFGTCVQLFLIIVSLQNGWDIPRGNIGWQVFSFISLTQFLSARGYTFFLALMYIMAVALVANVGLCWWVARSFSDGQFSYVWPIVVLKYFSQVFYQVLDVASMTLFLTALDCQYFPGPGAGYNAEFPEVCKSAQLTAKSYLSLNAVHTRCSHTFLE